MNDQEYRSALVAATDRLPHPERLTIELRFNNGRLDTPIVNMGGTPFYAPTLVGIGTTCTWPSHDDWTVDDLYRHALRHLFCVLSNDERQEAIGG